MKKWVTSLALCGALIGTTVVSTTETDAASVSASGTSFSSAWTLNKNTSDGAGVLTYGYNTAWINEDFAHGYHSTKNHYVAIQNGNGYHASSSESGGKTAKKEVRHSGNSVTYSMFY